MERVQATVTAKAKLDAASVAAIHESVAEMSRYLSENPVSAAVLESTMTTGGHLAEHTGNVFYLSMLLGSAARDYVVAERERQSFARKLDYTLSSSLTSLGLGAMVMNVGMLPLRHLFLTEAPPSARDQAKLRDHPLTGVTMIPDDFPAAAKMIVRTHHENIDGTGYPLGLTGDRLHVFTRIVRIADAFSAATARHVYKEAKSPVSALWGMAAGPYRQCYDPELMRIFLRLVQPFPIGSRIQLADGRTAVVIRYNRTTPLAPTVVIAYDSQGRRLPKTELEGPFRLGEIPELQARAVDGEALPLPQDDGCEASGPPPAADCSPLFEAAFP
jgi:response regulator RpfG family c-di-GMP phosphodiesterase